MKSKKSKMLVLSAIVIISLICIFTFYFNSKKVNRTSMDYEILNSIDTSLGGTQLVQISEQVENSINGAVTYLYSDSTKQKKINVSKDGFSASEWLMIVNTDSLKIDEDTLKLVISDVYEKKPIINKVNVVLSNDEKSNRILRKSIKMNEGGLYTIIPSVRGINNLNIDIYTKNDKIQRVYKFYAY